ncbi:MAG: glycosyltransferase family 39 protein [Deltaproteobacteria bacterium]|nr:glycosyltransferase family 39 protein [Deltaproteobacteria bacterium]
MSSKDFSEKASLIETMGSEHTGRGRDWYGHLGGLLPILTVYLILAFYRIDSQSLWTDEVISLQRAAPTKLIQKGWPLYFALLSLWKQAGTSELALRSLSVLLGAVAVCLVYVLSFTLFNRRVTLIGTALFATSPFLIWYSQEVRYVILMLVTAVLTMYAIQRVISRDSLGWWLTYGSTVILALSSFISTLLLPVAQGLYLLWSPSRRPLLRKWLVCQMLVFALFVWWAGGIFQKPFVETTVSGQQTFSFDPKRLSSGTPKELTAAMVPYTFFAFSTGFSLGPSLRDLHVSRSFATLVPHMPTLLISSILYGGLFFLGLIAIWRQPDVGMFLTLWVGVPIIGALGVSALTNMAYNVRYVAMALPAYTLILAAGIAGFRRPVVQITLLAAVLFVHGLSLANYYLDARYAREDVRAAARYLASVAHPKDVILVVGNTTALRYYYKGNVPIVSWSGSTNSDQSAVTKRLRELSKEHNRLWLVAVRPWETDPKGNVKTALINMYDLVEHKELPGVDIYSYQLSEPLSRPSAQRS